MAPVSAAAVRPVTAAAAAAAASSSSGILTRSTPALASPRLFHSGSAVRASASPLLSSDASPSAAAAGGEVTKKMNLFTALNDAMSEALRTDPKVSRTKRWSGIRWAGYALACCNCGDVRMRADLPMLRACLRCVCA